MDSTILMFLVQDGVVNGAVYALLGVALVLVFTVTRVVFIPQGAFVAYGGLTMAALEAGRTPGTAWLLLVMGVVAAGMELSRRWGTSSPRVMARILAVDIGVPCGLLAVSLWLPGHGLGQWANILLTFALVIPIGPVLYRIAFQPLADASVLVLFIVAVGIDLTMTGLGLVFFGPEGYRTEVFSAAAFSVGPLNISAQSIWIVAMAAMLLGGLFVFFERTLLGKALRASAVNRRGARLVGIPTSLSGRTAFGLAAFIGCLSGLLIAPVTTIYFDTGFMVGLKGLIGAIIGGLISYPVTAVAALVVGLLEAFSSFEASAFKEVIIFTVIIPVLLWRSLTRPHVEDEE